jgi:hypothetical protein
LCFGKVSKAKRNVNAVAYLRERRLRDVEKMQTCSSIASCKSFNNVRRHGICGASCLGAQLVPFVRRKSLKGKLMELDEEIVSALPGHKRMVKGDATPD